MEGWWSVRRGELAWWRWQSLQRAWQAKAKSHHRQLSPGSLDLAAGGGGGGASWRRHNFSHFQSPRPASLPRPGEKLKSKSGELYHICSTYLEKHPPVCMKSCPTLQPLFQQRALRMDPGVPAPCMQTMMTLVIGESLSAHLQSHASFNN